MLQFYASVLKLYSSVRSVGKSESDLSTKIKITFTNENAVHKCCVKWGQTNLTMQGLMLFYAVHWFESKGQALVILSWGSKHDYGWEKTYFHTIMCFYIVLIKKITAVFYRIYRTRFINRLFFLSSRLSGWTVPLNSSPMPPQTEALFTLASVRRCPREPPSLPPQR